MWDEALLFLVPFWCQIVDAFIVLRWATVAHMGLLFCTSLEFLYSYKWILFYTYILICTGCKNTQYLENETIHCHCRTDTSTTLNIHGPLETIGKTRCLGGFSVYCLTVWTCHECPWHVERHMEIVSCNYYSPVMKLGGVYWNHPVRLSVHPSVCLSVG